MSTVFIFLIVILVLVIVHELGHFFVAKAFKIRVDEFGVGYPPRARSLFSWKGTLFTLNWLPFGGFVKIYGEKPETEEEIAGSFAHARLYKRLLVIVAGVVANIVLAMILYAGSFALGFLGNASDFPNAKIVQEEHVVITDVGAGSPAEKAGLVAGDSVITLKSADEVVNPASIEELTTFIQSHADVPLSIDVERAQTHTKIEVTPEKNEVGVATIGIGIVKAGVIRLPFLSAFTLGIKTALLEFVSTGKAIFLLIKGALHGGSELTAQVSGPVGIAKFAGIAYGFGFGTLLSFAGLISINLAVINLFPFPALDGGRFILEIFSKNGRSKIGTRVVSFVNQAGFVLLIVLMIYITYRDIVKLFA